MSPAEISLNDPKVLNDMEWYSTVISGIPLALLCQDVQHCLILDVSYNTSRHTCQPLLINTCKTLDKNP